MKIAIISTTSLGGGLIRALEYKRFLEAQSHKVDLITINENNIETLTFFYHRVLAQLKGKQPQLMREIARRVEKKIQAKNYQAVIGVETLFSYVLTRKLDCLKVFSWESSATNEIRYAKEKNEHIAAEMRTMEIEICQHADKVIFPWETTENYIRNTIYSGNNFLTVRFGCHPKEKTALYNSPPKVISIGGLGAYWANPELLSFLTKKSPYRIDAYGNSKPKKALDLNFKGYAQSLDIMADYQFGLNTLSKDEFRKNHFSSRVLEYLSYGLPSLSPNWMKLSHQLKGCLPYDENNFVDTIEKYSTKEAWTKLQNECLQQAQELDWNITLKPLEKIFAD